MRRWVDPARRRGRADDLRLPLRRRLHDDGGDHAAWMTASGDSVCTDTTAAPSVRDFLNRMLEDGAPR